MANFTPLITKAKLMTKQFLLAKFTLTFILISIIAGCNQEKTRVSQNANTIVDDLDSNFYFESVPQKIITLAPNLTEFIYELGAENLLIGNTTFCNYPEEAKNVEKVGDLLTVDFEKIISLKPDLIFITVEGNSKNTYNKLKEYGIKVFVSNPRDFIGIKKTFRDFSEIFKKEETVERKITQWNSIVQEIKKARDKSVSNSAMFLISLKPIMLAGGNTFVNEFLRLCNLRNIADDSEVNYPLFSREEILSQNPEYIVNSFMNKNIVEDIKKAYPEWESLDAIRKGMIITVDPDLFFRPGPRFVTALEILNQKLTEVDK